MKRVTQIGFIFIGLLYFSYQYYKSYEKKERYKKDLINDLASRYRRIELNESKATSQTVKELYNLLPPIFLHQKKDSIPIYAELLNSFNLHLRSHIYYNIIYQNNDLWESAKLSGILSQFSKNELDAINKAYLSAERLNEIKKEIQKLPYTHFYDVENTIPNSRELQNTYSKYYGLLLKEEVYLGNLSSDCRFAISILDEENAIVKETDSLKTIITNRVDGSASGN